MSNAPSPKGQTGRGTTPDSVGGDKDRHALAGLDRRLAHASVPMATALVVGVVVIAALALHLLIGWMLRAPPPPSMLFAAALVAALVATPIVAYAQNLIRSLAASRRTLKKMTERLAVALHEAEQANHAKSRFLADMSHELRTPLNAIIGFSDIIREQRLGPVENAKYLDYAKDINESGLHLLGIISDILDLSKIEGGKGDAAPASEFAAVDAVEMAMRMIRSLAERQGVNIELVPIAPTLGLHAIERMVRQVLINILSNAVKFTSAGGIVRITAERLGGGALAIAVSDSGVGMTAEDIKVALTPFGQVANVPNRIHAGTGLGLPLAKAMMEMHGGNLSILSALHQGTRIVLTFPPDRVLTLVPAQQSQLAF